jgi:hypothetical protein
MFIVNGGVRLFTIIDLISMAAMHGGSAAWKFDFSV